MKKKIIILSVLIIVGTILVAIIGGSKEKTTYAEETNNSEEKIVIEESEQENIYEFLQVVTLKDKSKWIVLKQSEGYVELLSTGSKFEGSYNKDRYTGKDIFDRLEEYTAQLKLSLESSGADTNNIEVRIPTIEDFEKYFNTSSSEFLAVGDGRDRCGILFNDEQYEVFSKYFSRSTHMLNSTYPGSNDFITIFALSDSFKSFFFTTGGNSKNSVLKVAVVLKTPVKNITGIVESSND